MKHVFAALTFFTCLQLSAQIVPVRQLRNLDNYTGTPPCAVYLTGYGDKYVEVHGKWEYPPNGPIHPSPDTMFILNPDFTSFKTILLEDTNFYFENVNNPASSVNLPSVSDQLFNQDSALELAIRNKVSGRLYIVSEHSFTPLISGTLIRVIKMNEHYYATTDSLVYSLPGTLPCMQCSNISTGLINTLPEDNKKLFVYPNPFTQSLNVRYSFSAAMENPRLVITDILGQELFRENLLRQSDEIKVPTSGFSSGTILVSIFNGDSALPLSTKAIKIN